MAREFVLEIEKYLDHLVNNTCDVENEYHLGDYSFPDQFREAIGDLVIFFHGQKKPEQFVDKAKAEHLKEYFMLDFEDFLEYATSNLATTFSIDSVPHGHCYYYQALPGSFDKPLFANKYGKFSIMGACLSRWENHLWIIVQFKAETRDSLKKATRIVDLVTGNNNFLNYFVTLHLMDYRREAFSSDKAFAVWSNRFPIELIPRWIESAQEKTQGYSLVEASRSCLAPPFETDYEDYGNKWAYKVAGTVWTEFCQCLAGLKPKDDWTIDELEAYQSLMGHLQWIPEWEEEFHTEMADQFEVARLMRFLPSYFDFMYDLVIREKKEVGHERVRVARGKKKKTKIVERPIYKIVKSLRVSYLAEQETRQKLTVPQRKWTAPSYRFTVQGHWRQFSQPSWVGHDQDGKKLKGKTWVKDYDKGSEMEPVEFGTRSPNVVIKLKQPLSYARDVIKAHEQAPPATVNLPNVADRRSEKPSKEWMYQERNKLSAGLRYIIFRRDGYKCTICGKRSEDGVKLEVDHIIPIEKWGRTEDSNLRALCKDCNRGKGAAI